MIVLVAMFVALVVLGHVLLFSAVYKCWRDDWTDGRRIKSNLPSRALVQSSAATGEEDPQLDFSGAGGVAAARRNISDTQGSLSFGGS